MNVIERIRRGVEQFAVDVVLLGVGSMATFLSVKWTFDWQVYTGDPFFEALAFSLVVVLFAVVVFEFAVQEMMQKHRRAWLFLLMWLVVALYSMQTTVAGQYIGVKENELGRLEAGREEKVAGVKLEALEMELRFLGEEGEGWKARREQLLTVLGGVDTVEKRFEWKKNVEATEGELRKVNEEMGRIAQRKLELAREAGGLKAAVRIEELKGNGDNVFAFYSEVLGIEDVSRVEFVLAVFRGVILDTVNILCFMFVMMRRSRKEGSLVEHIEEGKEDEQGCDCGDGGKPEVVTRAEGSGGAEESLKEDRKRTWVEVLAKDTFSPGRRNRSFTSRQRARALGVPSDVYEGVVDVALRNGALVKRRGMLCRNEYYGEEEFIREALTVG